ncbi:MAG: rhamnogalacturonan lyase [Halobacteriaceae archaeon]
MTREVEALDRGLVAVAVEEGVYVRWRLLGTDPEGVAFNLYRDGERVTDAPIEGSTDFTDSEGTADAAYSVRPVVDGEEGDSSKSVAVWDDPHLDIPLNRPPAREGPDGETVTYHANDASVGDLTGDGSYDIVLKWDPSNSKDNAHEGHTSPVLLDGYTLDGDHLWRIDLGRNVRAGAHYTQFLVYDFDADGRAEVALRTADGTTDGEGEVIGDPDADHRDETGRVLDGPEFLTVFDGETGAAVETIDFEPARGDVADWGDTHGNRVDRFLGAVAYLDGERPSIVTSRGYYDKTALAAFDFRDGELTQRWHFDSDEGNEDYAGQGNHQLAVADVDADGKDEIVFGAAVIDHDGTGLYSTGWGHGDALHVGDFHPGRDGLEVYQVHEHHEAPYGASFRDAGTGELLWGEYTGTDTGRGMIADVNPDHEGAEFWAPAGVGRWTADGEKLGDPIDSVNFGIWWTGDLHRELLDHDFSREAGYGVGKIERWDHEAAELRELVRFSGTRSNNWTKGNPCLSGDVLGDWREEVIWRTPDSEALRLYVTTHETEHRIPTLMHDTQYRTAIAWQNVAYNQPPHPSFFLGVGMDDPLDPDVAPVGED